MTTRIHPTPKPDEASYVEGIYNHDEAVTSAFYKYCQSYFTTHFGSIFFTGEEQRKLIFHESFITLWEKIERHDIYAQDGIIYGKNGEPFTAGLRTFLMSIARNKYLEMARSAHRESATEDDHLDILNPKADADICYDPWQESMIEVIATCVANLTDVCNRLLTKFYFEEKNLDEIMAEMPTFTSKNALKSHKYKCMTRLRKAANNLYQGE